MSVVIYGIRNCDTIKKCLQWLDEQQIPYRFHDYRKDGLNHELLSNFVEQLGLEALLNKRGTTYRALSAEQKQALERADTALPLLLSQPAMLKRPLLCHHEHYLLGFDKAHYSALLQDLKPA